MEFGTRLRYVIIDKAMAAAATIAACMMVIDGFKAPKIKLFGSPIIVCRLVLTNRQVSVKSRS
jgi:hypothetical protein